MPAALVSLFLKTWVCVLTTVPHFIPFSVPFTCTSIHYELLRILDYR